MICPGSPPPMRGKVEVIKLKMKYYGITPAYAGKRSLAMPALNIHLGSPPPMRGKGHMRRKRLRQSGITPAYAGKSLRAAL